MQFRRLTIVAAMFLIPVSIAGAVDDPVESTPAKVVPGANASPYRVTATESSLARLDVTPRLPASTADAPAIGAEPGTRIDEEKEADKLHWELRGRIHADAIMVEQSPKNKADFGDFQNVVGFRRARLGAQGTIGEQVNWVAEFDFAGANIAFKDMYAGINELPLVRRIRIGNIGVPFSLEGQTNSNYFPFMERSPIMSLDPARKWGVCYLSYTENERATLQGGVFRSGTNSTGNDSGDGNDMDYIIRATILPWYDSDGRRLMHFGAAFCQQYPKDDKVTIGQGAQNNLLQSTDNPSSAFEPTITVPATQNQIYNVDWALVLGPLSFQAEWSATRIAQIGGGPVFLQGVYAAASLFLTGENRHYVTRDGTFGMTKVRSPFISRRSDTPVGQGWGAWELTVRFAYLNFNNANLPLTNGLKVGTNDAETTFGVNWYLNDHARIMFNYVHAIPVNPNTGPSVANAFFIRTGVFW